MPPQGSLQRTGEEDGPHGRSGHISGRALTSLRPASAGRQVRHPSTEHRAHASEAGVRGAAIAPAVGGAQRHASDASESPRSSEESFEAAPPRRRSQQINSELVKLVASHAPLELAQLKAMEQKARLARAPAPAPSSGPDSARQQVDRGQGLEEGPRLELREDFAAPPPPPQQLSQHPLQDPVHAPLLMRPSAAKPANSAAPSVAARMQRPRSGSPARPSHLLAAPAKGSTVRRDLNLLPNPVAQKQSEVAQRQAAVSAFTHRLQRDLQATRAEKEKRLRAEQEALAAQLAEEAGAAKAAAGEPTEAEAVRPPSVKRRRPASAAAGLQGMQAVTAEPEPKAKPQDPRPWRQNMRRQPTAVSSETPSGAPMDVGPKPAVDMPPPRNVSPGAAAARMRTLDPVSRSQLKEFMERKAKDMAVKQQQERAAQLEAKVGPLKVKKAEMARARERAHKYAEATKEIPALKGPRPAWVDIVPPEGNAPRPSMPTGPSRSRAEQLDADLVSERALPNHMSDAMRMEVIERRRQERLHGPMEAVYPDADSFLDSFGGEPIGMDPQVVRVREPEAPMPKGRVHRNSVPRTTPQAPNAGRSNPGPVAVRQEQQDTPHFALPLPPEVVRAVDLEARLAARKEYEQRLREMQAAERRDKSRGRDSSRGRDTSRPRDHSQGRDTSRGRDNSRGRRSSPTAGRKHLSASLNSRSRSPPKRAKQQTRRSRSDSRSGSANRRRPASAGEQPWALAGVRNGEQLPPGEYATAVQAEIQQARNERQVGDLWDLALQLSARLGALQQQGLPVQPQPPVLAWADPQQGLLQSYAQSMRDTATGHPQPDAVVPTGLPLNSSAAEAGSQGSPGAVHVQQFDEGVQAHVDFRSEVSWPTSVPKKMRPTADSIYGCGTESSAGAAATRPESLPSSYNLGYAGASGSVSSAAGAVFSAGHRAPSVDSSRPAASAAVQIARSLRTGSHKSEPAHNGSIGDPDSDYSSLPQRQAALSSEADHEQSLDQEPHGQPWSPGSPSSKHVPAAPIIQIPMPSNNQAAPEGVEPSPGLPYDNAAFSADSADDDGSSSGSESTYGKRVLTIAELHGMLESDPNLAQRLSLDRVRGPWEQAEATDSSPSGNIVRLRPRPRPTVPEQQEQAEAGPPTIRASYEDADLSSGPTSSSGTPVRACEEVVTEYEQANSRLSMRPAQRELLKAQAAQRAQEQADEELAPPRDLDNEMDSAEEASAVLFPKAGDPMSVINLIAHKGRVPARPAIIQLSAPPLSGAQAAEQGTQTVQVSDGGDGPLYALAAEAASEVLVIPSPQGPQLVFSRGLLQPQRPQLPKADVPDAKRLKETGVGEGRIDVEASISSSAQLLTDSLPPYVLLSEGPRGHEAEALASSRLDGLDAELLLQRWATVAPTSEQGPLQQQSPGALGQSPRALPTMAEQLARLGDEQLHSRAAADSAGGHNDVVGGIMASPPPRPRMVTFLDEVQGPPERVRLAPTELFKQMQDTIKTYEELDAAEVELQQLQNARAIAAVQREAHRIAQRLDQTAATETQLQLIAQTQADMDAKLHAFEENMRSEVRKESLGHLHDVTSLFVQQLKHNKVAHATVQTASPSPPRHVSHEIGIQVDPPSQPYSERIRRSSSPTPPHPQRSHRSSSPEQLPRTSLRATSPPQVSLRSTSPPPTSLRSSPPPQLSQQADTAASVLVRSPSRAGNPGLDPARYDTSATANPASYYSEDFEDYAEPSRSSLSQQPGRPSTRAYNQQASHLSMPESVYEEVEPGSSEEQEAARSRGAAGRGAVRQYSITASIPESISHYERDRQPARAAIRQISTVSIPESVVSEQARPQASTLSIAESVPESAPSDYSALSRPKQSVAHQASTISIAESLPSERTAPVTARAGATWNSQGGRRPSTTTVAESVAFSSFAGGDSKGASTVQESLLVPSTRDIGQSSNASGRSRRRRSTAADTVGTSEPGYSMEFDADEEVPEDDIPDEVTGSESAPRLKETSGTDVPTEEASEPTSPRSPQRRSTATTASVRSASGLSRSYSQDVQSESGLKASSSGQSQARPRQHHSPPRPMSPVARAQARIDTSPGAMSTPVSARNAVPYRDAKASPFDLRASKDGGLDLDNALLVSFLSDAEARMHQELALLNDRLQAMEESTAAKMAELEAELATETVPQRCQALIRAQRMLQMAHDAKAADVQRQIGNAKADFARHRLMVEGLYRLANITGPAAAASQREWTPRRDVERMAGSPSAAAAVTPTSSRRTGAVAPSAAAPALGAARPQSQRRASTTSSILGENSAKRLSSSSGGVERSKSFSVAEELPRPQPSTTGSVAEESLQGSPPGQSRSVASEVHEYSDEFEPPSAGQSRRHLISTKAPRLYQQPSSVMDDIEENLSQRRLAASGYQSQSVAEDIHKHYGSDSGQVPSSDPRRRSGESGAESVYSQDSTVRSAQQQPRARKLQGQTAAAAASDDLDGGASELSVLSADLERQKAELQRILRRREKELREQERRAKIQAKQAAVEELQRQVAALEQRRVDAAAPARKPTATAPATAKPAKDKSSSIVSEVSMEASSGKHQASATSIIDEADEVASATAQSLLEEVPEPASSVKSESIRSEVPVRRPQSSDGRSSRQPASETESVSYTEPDEESKDGSSRQRSSGSDSVATSEAEASRRLAALQKAVADKERELRRLQRQAEEEALQRRLRELEQQEMALKAKPVPSPANPVASSATLQGSRPAAPSAAQPYGTSGASTSYSEDFPTSSGTGAASGGIHSTSSIRDEVHKVPGARAPVAGHGSTPGSQTASIVDEFGAHGSTLQEVPSAAKLRPSGDSRSGSYLEDETSMAARSGALHSSGGASSNTRRPASTGQSSYSASGDAYGESFESGSARGASLVRDASELLDETEAAASRSLEEPADGSALQPISEEGAHETSMHSVGQQAQSTIGDEVDDLSEGTGFGDGRPQHQHSGGNSIAEESLGAVAASRDMEHEQEVTSIADLEVLSHSPSASATASIRSVAAAAVQPGSPPPASEGSQQHDVNSVQEFLVTADIESPSAAPSVHSAELVAEQSSSLPEASADDFQHEVASVQEFMTTAGTLGPSFAPSVHSADLVAGHSDTVAELSRQYSEVDEASGAVQHSDSSSVEDLQLAGLQERSAASLQGSDVEDLEIDYSGSANKLTADGEVEDEEEPLVVQEHQDDGSSSATQASEVLDDDEYTVDAASAGEEEEQGAAGHETLMDVTDLAVAEEPEDKRASASGDITDDVAEQPSAVSMQKSASAVHADGSQDVDDYELDFQPSAVEAEEVEAEPSVQSGMSASGSRLASTGVIVQDASELMAQTSLRDVASTSSLGANRTAAVSSRSFVPLQQQASSVSVATYEDDFASTGAIVQDASELVAQTSLRDVASTSSLGANRTAAVSSRSFVPLQQQASSVSAATYEDDFEEGEVSEAQFGGTGLAHTTLSVVAEEDEGKPLHETGSKMYTDDFASSSAALSSAAIAEMHAASAEATAAAKTTASAPSTASPSEADDVIEDADIEYEEDAEEPESGLDDQQYSSVSGAPLGPMLQPSSATPVGMEVSQRYGPSSGGTSGGYSEDFADADPAEEAEASPADSSEEQLPAREPSVAGSAAGTQPQPGPAAEPTEPASVLSVEEEAVASPTASSKSSEAAFAPSTVPSATQEPASAVAKDAPQDSTAPGTALRHVSVSYSEDPAEDDYTRDFSGHDSDIHAVGAGDAAAESNAVSQPQAEPDVVSHPISQAPSPAALSDDEVDAAASAPKDGLSTPDEELPEELEDDADLDFSDLGLDNSPAPATGARPVAPSGAAHHSTSPDEQPELASAGEAAGQPEAEDSAVIYVPPGRGLRQTRQIESRVWRSQQSMLEDEDTLEGDLDLVDVTMAADEGGGLLEMLGADLIEASEALTPSHSFRNRVGELAAGPSSGSPFAVRSSPSTRLATLREQQDQEGEDTEASSEAVSPHVTSRPSLFKDIDGEALSAERPESAGDAESAGTVEPDEVEDVEEEVVAAASSDDDDSEGPFKAPATPPEAQDLQGKPVQEQAPAASATSMTDRKLESAPTPAAGVHPVPEPSQELSRLHRDDRDAGEATKPEPEASAEPSAQYSDGLEAPSSNQSGGQQSVVEYDMYASAALADDSDDLAEYAAAFESQAIGVDDDGEGASGNMSGISASGLSDDLSKYQVTVQQDSDDEAAAATGLVPSAAETTAATAAPPPASAEQSSSTQELEVEEELEVVEEESVATGNDPFTADESTDRLPTLQPLAALSTAAPGSVTALPGPSVVPEPAQEPQHEGTVEATSEVASPGLEEPATAARVEPSSPTVSSPKSEQSGRSLPDETSLGPLPKSGLGGDDDDDGQGLEYRAVYAAQDTSPTAKAAEGAAATPFVSIPPGDAAATTDVEAESKGGLLEQLRAIAGSDDGVDEFGSGSVGGRGLSSASLKPAFQALLDQPDSDADFPKGDFESEIEEMLAASRSKSRLMSPYQSRDWGAESEAGTPEVTTPYSLSARASMAGISPTGTPPQPSTIIAALAAAASASATTPSTGTAPDALDTEPPASPAPASRDDMVDQITESTVKELLTDAVEAIVGVTGSDDLAAESDSPLALASPRGPANSVQLSTASKHRLSQASSFHYGEESPDLPDVAQEASVDGGDTAETPAANPAEDEEPGRVSMGGEASISMSAGDLEGDIELEGELEEEPGLDLPSPLQSDSGSIGSPTRHLTEPYASKPAATAPVLAAERSDRDLAPQPSDPDISGGAGAALTSDEDLGWGGADEDAELEEGWQPDLSGYIAPEIDQAAIEREHAPAVATNAEAVATYVQQVLDQFMDNRPEFILPGAEPLSLEGFLAQERRLVDASEAQHIHNKMLYDAINEALLGVYRAANRVQIQPWLRHNHRFAKPLPSPADMAEQVQQQIRTWSAVRMRDPAETDKVLAADAQEDERAWADLSAEEAEVQREVADLIWSELLSDTANAVMEIEDLLSGSGSRGALAAGRRRMGAA